MQKMVRISFTIILSILALTASRGVTAQVTSQNNETSGSLKVRERLSMDRGWRFAFGHATDPAKDFNYAGSYFSYYAKTGNGAGPAAMNFRDSSWRYNTP